MIINNKRVFEKDRYLVPLLKETKSICCSQINIMGTNLRLLYADKEISNPLDLTIDINTPFVTPDEYNYHDPDSIFFNLII